MRRTIWRIIWHSLILTARLAALIAATVVLLLRYWALPNVDRFHDEINVAVTDMVGSKVTIGKIEGDWEGLQPHLSLTDVRLLDMNRQPALILPRVESRISLMSLFSAELRLASLKIDQPELLVRRDAQGKLFLGDVSLSSQGADHSLANWLLHQSNMVVQDALIVWVDQQREAPPLVLQKVNLHIANLADRHRFSLHGTPPEDLATPLDVRGDFQGETFDDLSQWRGRVFAQIDSTDVVAWRPWMDLPREFSRGRGALRAWLDVDAGSVAGVTADMELYNVVAKLADDTPELALSALRGRASWKGAPGRVELSTRELAIRFPDGTELPPVDLYFRASKASDGQPAAGELRANFLQLDKIVSLASYLPLGADQRAQLEAYSPRGTISSLTAQWRGALEKPDSYSIKAHFEDIALRQNGKLPGVSGLTLDVEGNNAGGRLTINSRRLVVDAPGVMPEPLAFRRVKGQVSWLRQDNELKITLANSEVANDDFAGNASGSYQTQSGTLGVLDLTANLTRGDIRHASRYIPLIALGKEGNDWLKGALIAGHTDDFKIRIKGNLSDFPLNGTKEGIFALGGHAQGAVLQFANDWPRIEKIAGEFSIQGNKMEVKAASAVMAGTTLKSVLVSMPDMASKDLALEIRGDAEGGNDAFLQFIQQSPVRGYIGGLTDGVRASGNGHLSLFVRFPLRGSKPVEVAGNFKIQNSDIDPGKGVPWLRRTTGVLSFTEAGIQASGVSAQILGGPSSIDVQTDKEGAVHVQAKGRCDLDAVRRSAEQPMLDYLHGSAAWDAGINVANKRTKVSIRSDLRGISSDLPPPFAKAALKAMPLRLEQGDVAEGQDVITAQLGGLLSARFERNEKNGTMAVTRGVVTFGGSGRAALSKRLRRSGVWLAGTIPQLSLQGWDGLVSREAEPSAALPVAGANLRIAKLTGYGQIVNDLQVNAGRRGDGLFARLASDNLNGELTWLPRGYKKGAKFSAHLRNFRWVDYEQPEVTSVMHQKTGAAHPARLPAVDIDIQDLQIRNKQFGRVELVGYPEGKNWRLRRLSITNPDGSLSGDGVWRTLPEGTQTQVALELKLDNAGKTLARYGYPGMVKDGGGSLGASLSWAGAPYDFNYASLDGSLKLNAGNGRFLKMDPGAGKLLSILSLQALPSHITLDFNDVFSKGFQFENISGNASIKGGVIDTQDLSIAGSAAKVKMNGTVDMNTETQNLNVKIYPAVGDSVSLIRGFIAGPAVGIGTLIVNQLLGNPLDKLVSFEYNVTGTWSDPNVVKVVEPQPKLFE